MLSWAVRRGRKRRAAVDQGGQGAHPRHGLRVAVALRQLQHEPVRASELSAGSEELHLHLDPRHGLSTHVSTRATAHHREARARQQGAMLRMPRAKAVRLPFASSHSLPAGAASAGPSRGRGDEGGQAGPAWRVVASSSADGRHPVALQGPNGPNRAMHPRTHARTCKAVPVSMRSQQPQPRKRVKLSCLIFDQWLTLSGKPRIGVLVGFLPQLVRVVS